jgi:3',5'-cyclic AMP phosphodiesterase CpdA
MGRLLAIAVGLGAACCSDGSGGNVGLDAGTEDTDNDTGTGDTDVDTDSQLLEFHVPTVDLPYTTLQGVWAPLAPSEETAALIDDGELEVTELGEYLDHGLGVVWEPGLPWIEHQELAPDFSAPDPAQRRSLAYIWLVADPQLIDEESPVRFEGYEELFRPHGHLVAQVFDSHVQTARQISDVSTRPFDFALVPGDLTDGNHQNEVEWFLLALNGGEIDPDTGIDDDPVIGLENDYNDPFVCEGLAVPWFAALGNHDSFYNGGFGPVSDEVRAAAIGGEVYHYPPFIPLQLLGMYENGYRDGSTVYGDVVKEGSLPADDSRLVLRRSEVLQLILDSQGEPAGHGLTQEAVDAEIGYFSLRPIPDKPLRLIVLNTSDDVDPAIPIGMGALGTVKLPQLLWLQAELDAADAQNELIIVMSHHSPSDFSFLSPVPGSWIEDALEASTGVVLHLVGHSHNNEKRVHGVGLEPPGDSGYWELVTASTVDFPMHSRVIELVDEGNGVLSVYVTNVDHNAAEDSLVQAARHWAAGKLAFPEVSGSVDVDELWAAEVEAANLLLRIRLPDSVAEELADHDWPDAIESEETLLLLDAPEF